MHILPRLKAKLPGGRRLKVLTPGKTSQLTVIVLHNSSGFFFVSSNREACAFAGPPPNSQGSSCSEWFPGAGKPYCVFQLHKISCQKTVRGGISSGRFFLVKPGKAYHSDLPLEGWQEKAAHRWVPWHWHVLPEATLSYSMAPGLIFTWHWSRFKSGVSSLTPAQENAEGVPRQWVHIDRFYPEVISSSSSEFITIKRVGLLINNHDSGQPSSFINVLLIQKSQVI